MVYGNKSKPREKETKSQSTIDMEGKRPLVLVYLLTFTRSTNMTPLLWSDLFSFASQILPRRIRYQFTASDLPPYPVANNQSCSVLTYNVNYDSPNQNRSVSDKILAAITQSEADIVLLQETNQVWEELLSKADIAGSTRYQHHCFHHPNKDKKERSASGSAILSRYPITDVKICNFYSEDHPQLSGSVFPAMVASIQDTPIGTLEVANIHLRPPLELDGSATFSTARTTGPIREAEIAQLLQQNQRKRLDIVAGDFNEQDGADALRLLCTDKGSDNIMVDALQEHVPTNKETHRWPFGRFLTMHKRLDHICYRQSTLKCIGCGVLSGYESGASDHQPVLAKFAKLPFRPDISQSIR